MERRTVNKPLLKKLLRMQKEGRTNLAKAVGCSPHTVSNWIRDRWATGLQEYHAIPAAAYLGVDVDILFPPYEKPSRAS